MRRLAIFDVDGTLIDSQHIIVAAMQTAFTEYRLPVPAAEQVRRIIGLELVEAVERLLPDADRTRHEVLAAAYKEAFFSLHVRPDLDAPMYAGIKETLQTLGASGWTLAIATGKSRRGMERALDRHELRGTFVSVQTVDDNPGKPDPAMLYRALSDASIEAASAVMIGDTSYDMIMAGKAGIRGLGVTWGYHAHDELIAAGAAALVHAPRDIPDALDRLFTPNAAKAEAGLAG